MTELDPVTPAWEQQPGEGVRAFEAFCAYRDAQPAERSYRGVAQRLGKSGALMSRWSSAYRWVARAAAWDAELDRRARAELVEARRKAQQRHIQMAQLAQAKVSQGLLTLQEQNLKPADLIRLFDVAVRIEREAMGEASRHEITGPGGDPLTVQMAELAGMTTQQRQQAIAALLETVRRRVGAVDGDSDDDEDG